jgi:hypothetical protein
MPVVIADACKKNLLAIALMKHSKADAEEMLQGGMIRVYRGEIPATADSPMSSEPVLEIPFRKKTNPP